MKERNQSELDKIVFPELYNPFFRFNLSFFIAELHRFLWSLLAGYTLYHKESHSETERSNKSKKLSSNDKQTKTKK